MQNNDGNTNNPAQQGEEAPRLRPEDREHLQYLTREEKQVSEKIERLKRPKRGMFEAFFESIAREIQKQDISDWPKVRTAYNSALTRDVALLTRVLSFGMLESFLGRDPTAEIHELRAYKKWINEKIKEYKELQIPVGTVRECYMEYALDAKLEHEAWALATVIADKSDLNHADIEKIYSKLSPLVEALYEDEIITKDKETGQLKTQKQIKIVKNENGVGLKYYAGEPMDLMLEGTVRKTALMSGEITQRVGFRKAIKNESGKVIDVRFVTIDEYINDAESTMEWGAGSRQNAPTEIDYHQRYNSAAEVEAAVVLLERQVGRLQKYKSQYSDAELQSKLQNEIADCLAEINVLAPVNPKTGDRDYSQGEGRVKSFMIDWSVARPKFLMKHDLENGGALARRALNLEPVVLRDKDGKESKKFYVWELGMDPAYLKWLWSFNPSVVVAGQRLKVSNYNNWQDLLSSGRRVAFERRARHDEYGARNVQKQTDEVKVRNIKEIAEQGVGQENAAAKDDLKLDAYQSIDKILDNKNRENQRLWVQAQTEISELSIKRIGELADELLQFAANKNRPELVLEIRQNKLEFAKQALSSDEITDEYQKVLELAQNDPTAQIALTTMRRRYREADQAKEVANAAGPLMVDLQAVIKHLKSPAFASLNLSHDFRPNKAKYEQAYSDFDDIKLQEAIDSLPRFVNQHAEVLGFDKIKLDEWQDNFAAQSTNIDDLYHNVRLRLKANQLKLRQLVGKDKDNRREFAELMRHKSGSQDDDLVNFSPRGKIEAALNFHDGYTKQAERALLRELGGGATALSYEEFDRRLKERRAEYALDFITEFDDKIFEALTAPVEQVNKKKKQGRGRQRYIEEEERQQREDEEEED